MSIWRFLYLKLMLMSCLAGMAGLTHASPDPDQVRAALIFKLAKFVTWSDEAHAGATSFRVCTRAEDNVAHHLRRVEGKRINGLPIVVERVNGDHSGCHVLVLSAPDAVPTSPGTLTIGRNDEFLDSGGMIALGAAGKRMVFDINLDALREQRLEISSEVLDLARSVR